MIVQAKALPQNAGVGADAVLAHVPGERGDREEKLATLLKGHRDMVMEVAFSPNGHYLLTGSADHSLMLWDVETGERIHHFLDNDEAVLDVVFHPDGNSFYSISLAGDATRWALDPEIFVLRYFETAYLEELSADPLFEPKRKGEAKKVFQLRLTEAKKRKAEITDRYYQQYLNQKE